MQENKVNYWARQGAKIRSTANDIKRNAQALSKELGENLATIEAVFDGEAHPQVFDRVIHKMVQTYPLSHLDLAIRRDDTDEGVVLQTPDQALATSRIFARADRSGKSTPYYEYRDAAMSAVGPYRPEWIKELRIVDSDDPTDPNVAYNKGHLMHQATFFVGPVNFYWKIGEQAYMERMDSGDSNYITPFVPHSFASRDSNREAYIVAVTFSGKLESVHQDIVVLDPAGVKAALLDLSDRSRAFSGILRRELASAMLSPEHLKERTGLSGSRLANFLDGSGFPVMDELVSISNALGTNLRDLLPPEVSDSREVVVEHKSPDRQRTFPSDELPRYQVEDLAASRKVPFLNGLAVNVTETSPALAAPDLDLTTPSHEFCFNYGTESVVLSWLGRYEVKSAMLEPGGSYYIKPTTRHALRSLSSSQAAEVVIMRLGGSLWGEAHLELSSYPTEALHRVFRDSQQWYDPNKIGG